MKKPIFLLFILLTIHLSCQKDLSPLEDNFISFPPTGIDTTSHNFKWEIDTLDFPGAYQILPNAIWGADTNDVWMVAHSDDWHARIWHWDGQTWQAYTESGLGVSPKSMIGFSKNDIWFCGRRIGDNPEIKTIQHWDGTSWSIVEHSIEEHIMSVWGANSKDMFFGLIDGRIAHYNGIKFSLLSTGSRAQILNIQGTSYNSVYAIGIERDNVQPYDSTYYYIFKYSGKKWKIFNQFLQTINNPDINFPNKYLWSCDNYLLGTSGRYVFYLESGNTWNIAFEAPSKGVWSISGSGMNDIFTAGYLGENIFHFNGEGWINPVMLKDLSFFGTKILSFPNHVFISGYYNNKAYVIRGRRWSN